MENKSKTTTDSSAESGLLGLIVRRLFPHKHYWQTTHTNGFGMPTQQICVCGAVRHRFLKSSDLPDVAEWEEGKRRLKL